MRFKSRWSALSLFMVLAMLVSACGSSSSTNSGNDSGSSASGGNAGSSSGSTITPGTGTVAPSTDPVPGGDLHFASDESAPTLDAHRSGVTATTVVVVHLYEGLYAMNSQEQPIPMLAEGHEISPDGLTYTFKLRQGVKFHKGKEMTSEDVLASLTRWGEVAGPGKTFFANVNSLNAPDAYTLKLELKQPSAVVLVSLATPNQMAAIYPKEVVESADPTEGIREFIGTGPYQFVENIPDRHIRLTRFEGYQPVDLPADGLSGKKVAYVDNLFFHHATDSAIRVAGVETNQYQFADFIPSDEYPRLRNSSRVQAIVTPPRGWDADVFNMKQGLMSDIKMRQAWQAALDVEMVTLSQGQPEFARFDPSIMLKEMAYHSLAGAELYNQKNVEKAKQLLGEAGYDGTPIRWMVSTAKQNFALAAKQQLEAAGFVIDLQVMEWATVVQRRANPEIWEVFSTGYTMRPEPTDMAFLNCGSPPFWCDDQVADLIAQMRVESDFNKRKAHWDQIQALFHEQVPIVKYGDYATLRIASPSLEGYANYTLPFFWNVWFAQK